MHLKGKGKRTKITSEILEKMVGLRKRGFTYEEIAEELDISSRTIANHMRKVGLGGKGKKVTGEVMERMRNLRKAGVCKKEIAKKLNLSYKTVLDHLKGEELGLVEKLKRRLGLK